LTGESCSAQRRLRSGGAGPPLPRRPFLARKCQPKRGQRRPRFPESRCHREHQTRPHLSSVAWLDDTALRPRRRGKGIDHGRGHKTGRAAPVRVLALSTTATR
jgi:hypothetical protein